MRTRAPAAALFGAAFPANAAGAVKIGIAARPHQAQAFELAPVEFIDENGGGPGVQLHEHQRTKKRKGGTNGSIMEEKRNP